ncbi:MAG: SpoIIE family protein phosphatase [Planctomycetes bacterium]|nr:SpoIIE family protein phosphatase [Planctomycetota bacterium]
MAYLLIVEAEQDLRDRMGVLFTERGHLVECLATTAEATKSAEKRKPDVLIASVRKDSESDVAFLERIPNNRRLARVPIILITEGAEAGAILKSYQCDVYAILKKPVDLDHLDVQVETVVRQTMRQQQSRKREREELRNQIQRLEREIRTTTDDLTDAAQNFVTMLARPPQVRGLKIDCHFAPSGGFIGGDFYDFCWLDNRRLAIIIGDVTGHGIQAAVIQSMARKVISIGIRLREGNIREALRFANDELAGELPQGKFVACMVGVLDVLSGEWTHCRCGVPHPVVQGEDNKVEEITTAGVALGLRRTSNWEETVEVHERKLSPGSRLVLFSDGILETPQEDGEEFDYKGMRKALEHIPRDDANVARSIANVARAGHLAQDDVLIIAITREDVALDGQPEEDTTFHEDRLSDDAFNALED